MKPGNSVALYLPSISGDNDVISVTSAQQPVKYHRGHGQVTFRPSWAVRISRVFINALPPDLFLRLGQLNAHI